MQRKALFVGINDYEGGLTPLSCACNDANDLCDYFRDQLGYDTSVLRNADILKIRKKIAEVTAELQKGDVFLFFFAGHGFTVDKGERTDRRLATARDLKDHLEEGEGGISLRRLKKLTKGGYSRIFILDACQTKIDTTNQTRSVDNLEKEKFRSRDLSIISSIVGTKSDVEDVAPLLVINSCNVGDVAYELERNGLFTWAFLEMLSKMKDNGETPVFNAKLVEHIAAQMQSHPGRFRQTPVFFTSEETIPEIGVFSETSIGLNEAATSTLVVCPICGKKNHPENTFTCLECGRDNLCLRHQDSKTFLCPECIDRKARDGAELNAAAHTKSQGTANAGTTIGSFVKGSTIHVKDCSGKVIGGFKVLETIQTHAGTQGTVYKAECVEDVHGLVPVGTVVALKVMSVEDEDKDIWCHLVKRTNDLANLYHPSVVKYFGCFLKKSCFNDLHVVVQEFLTGETLKDRLARHPAGLDADEAVMIIDSVLSGLSYISSHGIVHRDVKPGNIFLCLNAKGGIEAVKLIDFEIAKQTDDSMKTSPSNIIGSLDYMAPDFIDSKFHGDVQSDVFSIGVVFHEALTGKMPCQHITGDYERAIFLWTSRWTQAFSDGESPIKIHGRVNRLLSHADEVLSRALAFRRKLRYSDFDEFRADLKTIRYRQLTNGQNVYRLLQFLGKGAFGEVFKARHMQTGCLVAVKHLLKPNYADRFRREAKILKKINDPCFVHFIDSFALTHAGRREEFIVMDFLSGMPGSSLRDVIERANGTALPSRETLLAFAHLAHGLSVLHSEGIIHRDIKPSNLYYPKGHPRRVAIMDFAIARDMKGTVTSGQVPGTLDYMPPEVVLTDNRGGPGADIYALGLCLYEALTGKTAYPRLPSGTAAYSAFFARARNMSPPDLSDPIILKNSTLHDLLVQMTHPDLSKRLVDARAVERRLAELAEVRVEQKITTDNEFDKRPRTIGARRLGVCLRNARVAKGYSIEQVAAKTRMLPKIVQELENDDFHSITAPIYGRGFVKLYAECVGLAPEPLIKMFMEDFSGE